MSLLFGIKPAAATCQKTTDSLECIPFVVVYQKQKTTDSFECIAFVVEYQEHIQNLYFVLNNIMLAECVEMRIFKEEINYLGFAIDLKNIKKE